MKRKRGGEVRRKESTTETIRKGKIRIEEKKGKKEKKSKRVKKSNRDPD